MVFRIISVDHPVQARGDDEAFVCGLLGSAEQLTPIELTMIAVRHRQHPDCTRNAGRSAAQHRGIERQWPSRTIEEHRRAGLCRGDLAAVINRHLARAGIVIGHEGATADARTLRLHQRQHRLDGDRGVDGAAAAFEHFHAGPRRQRIGRDDEGMRGCRCGARYGRRGAGAGTEGQGDGEGERAKNAHNRRLAERPAFVHDTTPLHARRQPV